MARFRWIFVFSCTAALLGASLFACAGARAPSAETAASESITNNQEEGVDEGGIVKAAGDYLLVLRRGRLFTVRLGDRDLTPICKVDAFPPGSSLGTWYDEMLVHERTVVVVGYSYRVGATEIGLFDLDPQGCISHRSTHFLHSHDYYSSRNYASRLVDGKLIFYMPHYLGDYRVEEGHLVANTTLPSVRHHGGDERWQPVITTRQIHVPVLPTGRTTLHTVVTCDLEDGFDCEARGIAGAFGRTFYVSPRAVYVWVHGGEARSNADAPGTDAEIYRLPLAGGAPGAVRAWGVPTDQFSFRERDGVLEVLVRDAGGGDWMGGPERTAGGVALARIPVAAFAELGMPAVDRAAYTPLPQPGDSRPFQNRFVSDWVLYGTGTTWGRAAPGTRARLYAHPVAEQGDTTVIDLPHGVDRIEALGDDAVVVGTDGDSLFFSSLDLAQDPEVVDRFVRARATQGELRSHGFFFRPEGPERGVLGLPVRGQSSGWLHLQRESAEVLYLEVTGLRFARLGSLAAGDDDVDDDCRVSCVDWYGNSRPIFYRGRVFALLGYELVEGVVRRGRIVEVGRAHLYRDLDG